MSRMDSGRSEVLLQSEVLGLTHPEYPDFLEKLIRGIGRKTKKLVKDIGDFLGRMYRYWELKSREGAEIYNRAKTNMDERYAYNGFYIRSMQ